MAGSRPAPSLSVIVTVVDAGDTLRRCLRALRAQRAAPPIEIVVPYDDTIREVGELRIEFPEVRFLPLGPIATRRSVVTEAGRHELYDRRRSAGLEAATGALVAMLEDRGAPREDWAEAIVRLHATLPHAAIGGAIVNAGDCLLAWAVFFCDFGRYQPPFPAGPAEYLSDTNISYKRRALEATRELWRERYHETTVHRALAVRGETLFLTAEMVVEQRRGVLRLGSLLAERFHWGRLFAHVRARELSTVRRIALAVLSPALPILLFARLLRSQLAKRASPTRFLLAAPVTAALLVTWSAGEAVGYLTGEP